MFELNRKKGTATKLRARFPKVHPKAELDITFQRTLRIPDDGKDYPLPAGLGVCLALYRGLRGRVI